MKIKIKRVYEQPEKEDGTRILVDRLWPRGMTKEKAHIDLWLKEIAPSTELRECCGHNPEKWAEFKKRYRAELKKNIDLVDHLKDVAKKRTLTLVYAARDEEHNEAVVLEDFLRHS